MGAVAALGGCSATAESTGAWAFATLALALVGTGAWALGRLAASHRSAEALRAARAELRWARELQAQQATWHWATDASHRLLAWQGPRRAAVAQCALFDDTGGGKSALREKLLAGQAFADLRVCHAAGLEGSAGWLLAGVPRQDDLGHFAGFVGLALPSDEAEAQRSDAAALSGLMAASGAPALVAHDLGQGWRVQQFNAAAAALWPALRVQAVLADVLAATPPAMAQAWEQLAPGATKRVQAWRLAGFGPLPGGGRGLALTYDAAPDATADGDEGDTFSFTVSHDLRAPIRVVEGFTRIVKEDYGHLLDRVGNDHLDRVLGAAARMNGMIDALLTLAKLSSQPLARQPVNLSQLAAYVVDDLRRGAPAREAEFEIQPGLQTVGDPTLLRIVLENLLGNAWKYSARCARAQISLRQVPHGSGAAYVVRDNGAGFDMRASERLFGLFQRLHSASEFPGHGVGLASVRRIVRRHGGEIWAEAEVGRGAAFFFTLAA